MGNKFRKKVLENGFTVLFEKRNLPVVSVSIAVRSGGINEKLEEKGMHHFIEHMVYKGTKKRSAKKIAEEIELRGGELNGFTSQSVTCFLCKIPSIHLDVALDVLTDMVKNPKFDEKEMRKEKKVIFEEIKMRKDDPKNYVFDKITNLLYSGSVGENLSGTQETINAITRNNLIKKFKETYVPENMILTVVGDVEFEKVYAWAKKHFNDKKQKNIFEPEFKLKNEILTEKREGINQANFVLAYHSPLEGDKLLYASSVLITILCGGLSSRLFREIREKRNLAYSIHGDIESGKLYSFSLIYVGAKKEKLKEIEKLILKEYEKIAKNLSEKELNQVKKQLIGNREISVESSQSQMIHLLFEEMNGDAKNFYEYSKYIQSVQLKDVKKLASEVVKGKYSSFSLIPLKK